MGGAGGLAPVGTVSGLQVYSGEVVMASASKTAEFSTDLRWLERVSISKL